MASDGACYLYNMIWLQSTTHCSIKSSQLRSNHVPPQFLSMLTRLLTLRTGRMQGKSRSGAFSRSVNAAAVIRRADLRAVSGSFQEGLRG